MRDIAVVHHVGFTLGAHLAGGFDGGFGFVLAKIRKGVNFGSDKSSRLEVSVNDTCRLRGRVAPTAICQACRTSL